MAEAGGTPGDAGELGARLVSMIAEVVGVGSPASGNFFELGGDSLDALEVIQRILEITGVEVDVAILFETPQIEEFVGRVLLACAAPGAVAQREPLGEATRPRGAEPARRSG